VGQYDYEFQKIVGVFVAGVPMPIKMNKVTDGTSKTMMIAEKYIHHSVYLDITPSDDRGWTDGWDADTMRCSCIKPMSDSDCDGRRSQGAHGPCPPEADHNDSWYTLVLGSAHPGSFNAVFADGSVRSINYDVELFVLNAMGTRNGTSAGPLLNGQISSEVAVEGVD
jgi:prepilin-type processing-associated H-X9-DG protein